MATNKQRLTPDFVRGLLSDKQEIKFSYSYIGGGEWDFVLTPCSPRYLPFKWSLEGKQKGTNATWGRRYTSLANALLHVANGLNENANIPNRYSSIEDWIDKEGVK